MNDTVLFAFILINVVSLQTPADSQLVDLTITTHAGAPDPEPPKKGFVSFVATAPPTQLALCRWGKGQHLIGELERLGDSQGLLALGSPGHSRVFPRTFEKGAVPCLSGLLPPQVEKGVSEETLDRKPLLGGSLPTGVSCLTQWA